MLNMRQFFASVGVMFLIVAAACAHHILGLPHYSYKENYPQIPTLEYPAKSGPYQVLLTCYPGKPEPGEAANLAIYIKDEVNNEPYGQSIQVRVLQTFTFGRNLDVLPLTTVPLYSQPHELLVTFPNHGEYIVELTLDVEGKPETIPFLLVAGDPSATGSVLVAIGIFLAIFFIVVRAIRVKRRHHIRTEEVT